MNKRNPLLSHQAWEQQNAQSIRLWRQNLWTLWRPQRLIGSTPLTTGATLLSSRSG